VSNCIYKAEDTQGVFSALDANKRTETNGRTPAIEFGAF